MRKRAALAASLALAPASAYGRPIDARGSQAKAQAAYVVPAPPNVTFVQGRPAGLPDDVLYTAATDPATGTIYYGQKLDAFARAHEVGHLLDAQVLTDGDRRYFQRTLHARPGEWRPDDSAADNPGANETFADYYAAAATHLDLAKEGVSSYTQFGPKRLLRFERALARIAARRNLQPYQP